MGEKELEVMLRWMSTLGTVNALTFLQQGLVGAINQRIACDEGLSVRELTSEEMLKFLVDYLQVSIENLDKQIEEYKKILNSEQPKEIHGDTIVKHYDYFNKTK